MSSYILCKVSSFSKIISPKIFGISGKFTQITEVVCSVDIHRQSSFNSLIRECKACADEAKRCKQRFAYIRSSYKAPQIIGSRELCTIQSWAHNWCGTDRGGRRFVFWSRAVQKSPCFIFPWERNKTTESETNAGSKSCCRRSTGFY